MQASLETVFTFLKFQWPKKKAHEIHWAACRSVQISQSVCLYLDVAKHGKPVLCGEVWAMYCSSLLS